MIKVRIVSEEEHKKDQEAKAKLYGHMGDSMLIMFITMPLMGLAFHLGDYVTGLFHFKGEAKATANMCFSVFFGFVTLMTVMYLYSVIRRKICQNHPDKKK